MPDAAQAGQVLGYRVWWSPLRTDGSKEAFSIPDVQTQFTKVVVGELR